MTGQVMGKDGESDEFWGTPKILCAWIDGILGLTNEWFRFILSPPMGGHFVCDDKYVAREN